MITPKAVTINTKSDKDTCVEQVRAALNMRSEIISDIHDLKSKLMEQEYYIKMALVETKNVECLKVDWSNLNRLYRR